MKVGDIVTVKERREGYGSNYAGRPAFYFEPGMVGIVGAVKAPSVHRERVFFDCIDFFSPETGRIQRCSTDRKNIVKLKGRIESMRLLAQMAEQTPWLVERIKEAEDVD